MAGLFGVALKNKDCAETLFYGVDYHSHLGTDFAGIAVWNGKFIERKIHEIKGENFRPKFQNDYKRMKGPFGIGVIGYDIQPVVLSSKDGIFAIVINGNIANATELLEQLQEENTSFAEIQPDGTISPAEILVEFISRSKTIEKGVEEVFLRIKGSASMLT